LGGWKFRYQIQQERGHYPQTLVDLELEPWNLTGQSPGMDLNTAPLYRIQLSAVMHVTLLSVILGGQKVPIPFGVLV
jgi:hypothetical protein